MRLLAGIAAGTGLALALALPASAGDGPDSRLGDTLLGKTNGVAYVSDPEFAPGAAFIDGYAACPDAPGKWHIVGGGYELGGGADSAQEFAGSSPGDLDDVHGDNDDVRDDHWRAAADVSLGTTLTTYAVCTKWDGVKQKSKAVPDSPSGERTHVAKCNRGLISGGGGGISTSDSYMSSMFPKGKKRWKIAAYDTIGGIGGMANYFVCVRGVTFFIEKRTDDVPAGETSQLLRADCDAGATVVGGGVKSSGAPGALSLRASKPADDGDADGIPDDGWAVRTFSTDPGVQSVTAYAICAAA